jgi:hypothetical protein
MMEVVEMSDVDAIALHPMASMLGLDREVLLSAYGAIRPTKLGVKNWMFIGNENTGWRSAVIYTFVVQIRRHGMDPFAYFEWVFEKLMHNPAEEELEALLPENWIAVQRSEQNRQESAA